MTLEGLFIFSSEPVHVSDVVQRPRDAGLVSDLLTDGEGAAIVLEGLLVVPPAKVHVSDSVQRPREAGLVSNLLTDGEGAVKVVKGLLVVPPKIVHFSDPTGHRRLLLHPFSLNERQRLEATLQGPLVLPLIDLNGRHPCRDPSLLSVGSRQIQGPRVRSDARRIVADQPMEEAQCSED